MQAFADGVVTGEVARAVRSARTAAGDPVRVGQWIGIECGNDVVEVGDSMLEVARTLLTQLLHPSAGLVTVLVGEGAGPADVEAVTAWLAANHPRVEVEVHRADRPHYPLTFGVE
jgi:dihydroxyacetone kinase-like predicted kinase